jgi:tetratricopeptide (TPR) repeat protein
MPKKILYAAFAAIVVFTSLTFFALAAGEEEALTFAIGAYNDGFYDAAEQGFSEFVGKYPYSKQRPYALYLLGVTRFLLKKYKKAKETLTEMTDLYPKYERIASAHYFLGEACYITDDYKAARKSYSYVYKNMPADVSRQAVLFRLGELNFIAGDYKGAARVLSELKKEFKGFEQMDIVRLYLSFCYYYTKEYSKALPEFEHLLKKPDFVSDYLVDVLFFAADSAFSTKNYKASSKYYSEFLKKFKKNNRVEAARYFYAMSLYFTNNKEGALKELKGYYNAYPAGEYIYIVIEQLANTYFEVKNFKEANVYLTKLINDYGADENVNDWMLKSAWCYTSLKDYKKASNIYEKVEKSTTDEKLKRDISFLRAESHYFAKDYVKALEIYNKLKEDAKYKKEVLSDCYFFLKDYRTSEWYYTEYINKYPRGVSDHTYLKLAISLQNKLPPDQRVLRLMKNKAVGSGSPESEKMEKFRKALPDYEKAIKYYEKIISHKKNNYYYETALYNAAVLYDALDNDKNLIRTLQKLVKVKDAVVPPYFHLKLADSYFVADDFKNAIKYYELAIKSNIQDVMGESLLKLGEIYYKLNDLTKSLEHFNLAENAFSQSENVRETSLIYMKKGNIYEKLRDLDHAREQYDKVIMMKADKELKNIAMSRIKNIDKQLLDKLLPKE